MKEPRYQHDCKRCEFLGQYKEFDLYYCHQKQGLDVMGGSVIARRSSKDSDYMSSDLVLCLKAAVSELAYGCTGIDGKHLPPREGSPLAVAAAKVLESQRVTIYTKLEK